MAKRKNIAVVYDYNENWIGGTYYIQNLLSAINSIADNKKPVVCVFTNSEKHYQELKELTGYPYIKQINPSKKKSLLVRAVNKIYRYVVGTNLITGIPAKIAAVFPAANEYWFQKKQSFLYWIPDFQEHQFPHFFSAWELGERKKHQQGILEKGKQIVFSSEAARKDFNTIYPDNEMRQFVLPFAVTHNHLRENKKNILAAYNLTQPYFICSNQFWKHKNHSVILEALALAKQRNPAVTVVFTGKENDHRHPGYFEELKTRIQQLGIEANTRFLGFIPRSDQLLLMQKSVAVIQPSLFEGWSTVVEDAKSLGANIIASDIEVHKEQLVTYVNKQFFETHNAHELARLLTQQLPAGKPLAARYDYAKDVERFGERFMKIVEQVSGK
ncbi:MAG: glycosyltransferase [Chitinophagaceae bacterium]|nr:glycosyltransferase [Chitinophagaceae bacterium]